MPKPSFGSGSVSPFNVTMMSMLATSASNSVVPVSAVPSTKSSGVIGAGLPLMIFHATLPGALRSPLRVMVKVNVAPVPVPSNFALSRVPTE